jgi:hypothetical protein
MTSDSSFFSPSTVARIAHDVAREAALRAQTELIDRQIFPRFVSTSLHQSLDSGTGVLVELSRELSFAKIGSWQLSLNFIESGPDLRNC